MLTPASHINGEPLVLKYLFSARLADGQLFVQTPEDVDSENPSRSAFTELLRISENNRIREFYLEDSAANRIYSVNLDTGHFEANGNPFFLHTEDFLQNFQLRYIRQVAARVNVTFDKVTGHELGRTQAGHEVKYCFGWYCAVNGKSYERILTLK